MNDLDINVRLCNLLMRFIEEISIIIISITKFKSSHILSILGLSIGSLMLIVDLLLIFEMYYKYNNKSRGIIVRNIDTFVKKIIKTENEDDDNFTYDINEKNKKDRDIDFSNLEDKKEINFAKNDEIEDSKKTRGSFTSNFTDNSSLKIKSADLNFHPSRKIDRIKLIDSINENSDVNMILNKIGESENINRRSIVKNYESDNNNENDDYLDVIKINDIDKKINELKSYSTTNKKNIKNSIFNNDKDTDENLQYLKYDQRDINEENSKIFCKTDENLQS